MCGAVCGGVCRSGRPGRGRRHRTTQADGQLQERYGTDEETFHSTTHGSESSADAANINRREVRTRFMTTSQRSIPAVTLALIACAAVFIGLSSRALPTLVAAHFDAAGHANGYLRRGPYVAILLLITVVVPLLVVIIPSRALSHPDARVNLPNRDYWLAPERREATVRFLSRQMVLFAWLLVVFLCYTQWLVVRANALTPPMLDSRAFLTGLVLFLACTLFCIVRLARRFR